MTRNDRPYPFAAPDMDGYVNPDGRQLGDSSGRPLDCDAAEAKLICEIDEAAQQVLENVETSD